MKLATQVLSHSVSAAMTVLCKLGVLAIGHLATAEVFDKLFNCFNSYSLDSSTHNHHVITKTSAHWQFLEMADEYVMKLTPPGSSSLPCLNRWRHNIRALEILYFEVLGEPYCLMTNRLNQDCIESFFCQIRVSGGSQDNPNA